jgi:hypothetical protein
MREANSLSQRKSTNLTRNLTRLKLKHSLIRDKETLL